MSDKVYYLVDHTPGAQFAYRLFTKKDFMATLRRVPNARIANESEWFEMASYCQRAYIDKGYTWSVSAARWVKEE